jgi:rubredoxin
MFFILGARDRETIIASGYFLCPNCGQLRLYKHKRLARYFTLYFLPIFPLQSLGEVIQCQTCQHTYRLEELQQGSRLITEGDLLKAVAVELQRGLPFHRLQRRLVDDGLERNEVARILHEVTHGRQRTCPQCQFSYLPSIRYCTNCGHALSPSQSGSEPKRLE